MPRTLLNIQGISMDQNKSTCSSSTYILISRVRVKIIYLTGLIIKSLFEGVKCRRGIKIAQ